MRAILVVLALAAPAHAHGLRTAYVDVSEVEPGHALVHVHQTTPDGSLAVHADAACTLAPATEAVFDRTWLLACPGGFAGRVLAVDGLGPIVGDAVAYVTLADGTTATHVVRAADPQLELAPPLARAPSTLAVAREFVGLGLVHIITGFDHLLFLLLIVLLLRDVRSVLLAETAFTLSHSLSFTATSLGWIHVSSAAAEACIALSLLLLAADVRVGHASPRWRGAAMALVFGFVHGLGFAGGLRELGLPDHAIGTALLGFAGGIEIGQVAFLALALTALHFARRLARVQLATVYAIGSISACWLIERMLAL
jgi:hydrogenase/urease accessory protein HupE